MSKNKEIPIHRVLREVYRNFRQFQEFVSATGKDVIEHGYWVDNEDGTRQKVMITISYSDLRDQLNKLAARKREAMMYNVIMDMKQKDVAKIMGITTVSVGQYVDAACEQLAVDYFAENKSNIEYQEEKVAVKAKVTKHIPKLQG
jgi:DNA-directed RNA polymerase specialized sigma24 family protein